MKTAVFSFNGCDKCFNETLLLEPDNNGSIERVKDVSSWDGEEIDVAVITGYLLPENKEDLKKIENKAKRTIAFGNCAVSGGIYGLAHQKGIPVTPAREFINTVDINGCLGDVKELKAEISGKDIPLAAPLCKSCTRKSTCEYLDKVVRQVDPMEDTEACFNDMGVVCSGYIAATCSERCIDHGTPCRGCKPMVEKPGFRMLGMFGTLMGNIDIATEATGKGGTDKLADGEDDVTRSLPDIASVFFRYNLADSLLPRGKIASSGSMLQDIFMGRTLEELPLISGQMGGTKALSLSLDIIESYEKGTGIEISEDVRKKREILIELEKKLINAVSEQNPSLYKEITGKIRSLAGNMNLSNLIFSGFKVPISGEEETFDDYRGSVVSFVEGSYSSGKVSYSIDNQGIVKEFNLEE